MKSFFFNINFVKLIISLGLFFATESRSFCADRIYANQVTFTSGNVQYSLIGCGALNLSPCYKPSVINPANAVSQEENYARLLGSPGLVLGLGSYDGSIELMFPTLRPANSTVFIRVGSSPGLLDVLIGGSLAESLSSLVGSVLLGNQEIALEARNGATSVGTFTSISDFGGDRAKALIDKEGNYYIAITPSLAFDRVRITNSASAVAGIGSEFVFDVYHAFYFSESNCILPEFTSFDGSSGLNLELLQSNQNLGNAIDGNISTYSEFSSGLIGVGLASRLTQHVYFSNPSDQSDDLNLAFSFTNSLANVGLLQNALESIHIEAFLGGNSVYSQYLDVYSVLSLLGLAELDLLGILGDYGFVHIPVQIESPFDRVSVSYNSFVEINAIGGFRLHDVSISYGFPEQSDDFALEYEICQGDGVSVLTPALTEMLFEWYDAPVGGNHIGTSSAGEPVLFDEIQESRSLFVSARREGCIQESVRGLVQILAFENPVQEHILIHPQGEAMIDSWGNLVYPEGAGVVRLVPEYQEDFHGEFIWYWDEELLLPLIDGHVDDDGVTYILENGEILEIHNPVYKDGPDAYRFYVEYRTPSGCFTSEEVSFENLSIILPIELVVDFSARWVENHSISIRGEILKESGTVDIERANESLDFETISVVELEKQKSELIQFLDKNFNSGNNYYRLKYTDLNGSVFYSHLVRVYVELGFGAEPLVYPNPFENQIQIVGGKEETGYERYLLTDINGKILREGILNNQITGIFLLDDLSKGVYLLYLQAPGHVKTIKLIKN